jgi:hypothetical protein
MLPFTPVCLEPVIPDLPFSFWFEDNSNPISIERSISISYSGDVNVLRFCLLLEITSMVVSSTVNKDDQKEEQERDAPQTNNSTFRC